MILYSDGEVGPVEERVPDAEIELFLVFLWTKALLDMSMHT